MSASEVNWLSAIYAQCPQQGGCSRGSVHRRNVAEGRECPPEECRRREGSVHRRNMAEGRECPPEECRRREGSVHRRNMAEGRECPPEEYGRRKGVSTGGM